MAGPVKSADIIRFGRFELSADTGELRKDGARLKLSGQAIQVLAMLASRPGELVTREELQQMLWPGASFGDPEHGLNAAVNKLRDTLGDSAVGPKYIETVPGRGYRFIAVLESHAGSPEPEPPQLESPKPALWKRKTTIAVAACLLIAGLLYPWIAPRMERLLRLYEMQRLSAVPLTALAGNVWYPTFSPDGSQIAFTWDGGNDPKQAGLYAKVVGNDKLLRLTDNGSGASWSPNGTNIAFLRCSSEESAVFLISPLGGPVRRIASTGNGINSYGGSELSWSPDGKHLAYVYHPGDSASTNTQLLYLLALDTEQGTAIKTGCSLATSPAFSPRGDYLAWICFDGFSSASINLQRLSDGSVSQLLRWPGLISSLAWSRDERHIAFSSEEGDIWDVALANPGRPEKLPVGHDADSLTVSPASDRLGFTQSRENVNIWRLDLSEAEAQPHAQKLISSSRKQYSPDFSPDGNKITFDSNRSGHTEIWVSDADGSNAVQLTSLGIQETGSARWSPDGTQIAFDSRVGGESNVYIVDSHGGVPRKLATDIHGNNVPRWSHDGAWIYFENGEDARQPSVWKVSPNGGHAIRLANEGERPIESPDGLWVYFIRQNRLWRIKPDGTDQQKVTDSPLLAGDKWAPVGPGIYFLSLAQQEISFFDFVTGKVRTVYKMEKSQPGYAGSLAVSRDGKWLLFPQLDEASSDIMMVENWR